LGGLYDSIFYSDENTVEETSSVKMKCDIFSIGVVGRDMISISGCGDISDYINNTSNNNDNNNKLYPSKKENTNNMNKDEGEISLLLDTSMYSESMLIFLSKIVDSVL
jgi:hypothetical protein